MRFPRPISGPRKISLLNRDLKPLLILNIEISVSFIFISERLIRTSKIIIFQPTYSSSGAWVAGSPPEAQGGGAPLHHRTTHPHPHTLRLGQCTIDSPIPLMYTALGCGRKPESPGKTHSDIGTMCILHRDSGPASELIIFLISMEGKDVISGPAV